MTAYKHRIVDGFARREAFVYGGCSYARRKVPLSGFYSRLINEWQAVLSLWDAMCTHTLKNGTTCNNLSHYSYNMDYYGSLKPLTIGKEL